MGLRRSPILYLLDLAAELKVAKREGHEEQRLRGKNIALIFEKDSTRTRCAFEVAVCDQGQAAVVATIFFLSLKITDPLPPDPTRPFGSAGAVLSAAGMSFLAIGILQAGNNNTLLAIFLALGAAFLLWFFLRAGFIVTIAGVGLVGDERHGRWPLAPASSTGGVSS